jgi:putative peptide zinc metalloprotease protein
MLEKLLTEKKTAQLAKLTVASPVDGVVLPPPTRSKSGPDDGRLPGWTGSPFDKKNSDAAYA